MEPERDDLQCLMLIPRSGRASIVAACEEALPAGAVTDLDAPAPGDHRLVVVGRLEELVAPEHVAAVLREPGSRLLSLYAALRLHPDRDTEPDPASVAADGALHEFLADTRVAALVDNALARAVLPGDPRLPVDGFMAPDDAEAVADAAIERLQRLGCVAILELQDDLWPRLGTFLGAELTPIHLGEDDPVRPGGGPFPSLTADALALLGDRCAADALVYDHLVLQRVDGEEVAQQVSELALVEQLVRFGDRGGRAAARARAAADDAHAELRAAQADAEQARVAAEAAQADAKVAAAGVEAAGADADAVRAEVDAARAEAEAAQRDAEAARREGEEAGRAHEVARHELRALKARNAEQESELVALAEQLAEQRASLIWQVTSPLRSVERRASRLLRR